MLISISFWQEQLLLKNRTNNYERNQSTDSIVFFYCSEMINRCSKSTEVLWTIILKMIIDNFKIIQVCNEVFFTNFSLNRKFSVSEQLTLNIEAVKSFIFNIFVDKNKWKVWRRLLLIQVCNKNFTHRRQ